MAQATEQDILEAALAHWPLAAEVHVQFHTHVMGTRLGVNREGVCVCSVEGSDVRRQFTAPTPNELFKAVTLNKSDWKDYSDLIDEEDENDSGP